MAVKAAMYNTRRTLARPPMQRLGEFASIRMALQNFRHARQDARIEAISLGQFAHARVKSRAAAD